MNFVIWTLCTVDNFQIAITCEPLELGSWKLFWGYLAPPCTVGEVNFVIWPLCTVENFQNFWSVVVRKLKFVLGVPSTSLHSRQYLFLTNFDISKSTFRHSCSLVRDFQKWFQNENNSKIEVESKRQIFYQVLHKAKISKLSDWDEIENIKPPDPPDSKITPFVNFGP